MAEKNASISAAQKAPPNPGWQCDWHPEPTPWDWWSAAIHESGHAVALMRFFNCPFQRVSIYKKQGQVIGGVVLNGTPITDTHKFVIAALAGPFAEARYRGVPVNEMTANGGRVDVQMAMDAGANLDASDAYLLIDETEQLVTEEWDQIVLVAGELVNCHELDYEQVLRLIQS